MFPATVFSMAFCAGAAHIDAEPEETRKALSALLAASNAVIPAASTCHGSYGQEGKATVKDLVAMQLAYIHSGTSVIDGRCTAQACTVRIRRASGEDVSSATIEFDMRQGKANVATLRCLMTP